MDDFDKWNAQKKIIDTKHERRSYHEKEVRWCRLGKNIGFEQMGTGKRFERPVLIVRALSKETCIVIPLTTSSKRHPLRFKIDSESVALLSQIKVIDTKRLANLVKIIDDQAYREIKKAIRKLFE